MEYFLDDAEISNMDYINFCEEHYLNAESNYARQSYEYSRDVINRMVYLLKDDFEDIRQEVLYF